MARRPVPELLMRFWPRKTVRRFEEYVPVKEENTITGEERWFVRMLEMKELSDGTIVEIEPDAAFGYAFRSINKGGETSYWKSYEEARGYAEWHQREMEKKNAWREA